MNVDQFIDQQKRRGALDSSGRFTVNPYKAREKMARFQTGNPAAYLLRLVQAGVLCRSEAIDIRLTHHQVEVSYRNPELEGITPEHVVSNFGEPLAKGNQAPQGFFMNALNLLFADPPESISVRWRYPDGRERRVKISEAGMEESHDGHQGEAGLRVRLRRGRKDLRAVAEETRSVYDLCGCAPIDVKLDGKLVNDENNPSSSLYRGQRPATWNDYLPHEFILGERILTGVSPYQGTGVRVPDPVCPLAQHWRIGVNEGNGSSSSDIFTHDTPGQYQTRNERVVADGFVVIPIELQEESSLNFVQAGVVIQSRLAPGRGLHAWICADGLPTDLTGFQLLENEQSKELKETVEDNMLELREHVRALLPLLNARYDWTPQRLMNAGLTAACLGAYAYSGWFFWSFALGKIWAGSLAGFGVTGSAFTLQKRKTINEELRANIIRRL